MKIVYCLNSISYIGGTEKVVVIKANALAETGNEVHIVVTEKGGENPLVPLSPKVKLTNLDVNYYEDDCKGRLYVLKGIFVKRLRHKRRLKKALEQIKPDIVISVGQCEKYFLPTIKGDFATVREFHYAMNYRMQHAHSLFDRILAAGGDFMDRIYLRRYDRVVLLTEEDRNTNMRSLSNVSVIPNPLTLCSCEQAALLEEKKIISIGRLERQKNYSSLLRAFRLVADKHPDWSLEIYGEGSLRVELEKTAMDLGLSPEKIFKGASRDVAKVLCTGSVFVLSSLYEGFPLVLLEAMCCGIPVVCYSCPCGPKDVITEGRDGFLVPLGDESALAERIIYLIEHPDTRRTMGSEARKTSKEYGIENVVSKWNALFGELRG